MSKIELLKSNIDSLNIEFNETYACIKKKELELKELEKKEEEIKQSKEKIIKEKEIMEKKNKTLNELIQEYSTSFEQIELAADNLLELLKQKNNI